MKRLLLFIALVSVAHAAGSVQQNLQNVGGNVFAFSFNWVGDATNGTVPATVAQGSLQLQGYRVLSIETTPGSPAPTNAYSITLIDTAGVDIMAGASNALSNSSAQSFAGSPTAPPLYGSFTFTLTGNSVASAKGSAIVYLAPLSQVLGLSPTAPSFPSQGANLFYASPNGASGSPGFRAFAVPGDFLTNAQGNGSKAQLSTGTTTTNDCVKFDANGNTVDSGASCNTFALPAGTQTQFLRLQPNTGNNTTAQFAAIAAINASDYNFPAQAPGGTISVGSNTFTLTPCPLGVNGTNAGYNVYLSAGTGTAESVPVTGGSCVSQAATGTLTVTAANTHSGAWTVTSVAGGIPEAGYAQPGQIIQVTAATTFNGTVTPVAGETVQCAAGVTLTWGGAANGAMFSVANNNTTIRDCSIALSNAQNAVTSTSANPTNIVLDNLKITGGTASTNSASIGLPFGTGITIMRCTISGFNAFGILVGAVAAPSQAQYTHVIANHIDDTSETLLNGIGIGISGNHSEVIGNDVKTGGNQDQGILCLANVGAGMVDCTISGNTINVAGTNAFEGFGLGSVTGFSITGNVLYTTTAPTSSANAFYCIEVNRSFNGAVSGNSCFQAQGGAQNNGIISETSQGVNISGNYLTGYGSATGNSPGIMIIHTVAAGLLTNVTVSNNTLVQPSNTFTTADIRLETLTTGTVSNLAIEGNIILGNVAAGHNCIYLTNSGAATLTNLLVKGNSVTSCDSGIATVSSNTSIENNTITSFNTNRISLLAGATPRIIDTNGGTATATAGAASLNAMVGTITSESLTTAIGATYTLTLTDNLITAATTISGLNTFLGTSTQGTPQIIGATPGAGSVVIKVKNIDAANAFNGTIKIQYQAMVN